jgi:hypothetical protein
LFIIGRQTVGMTNTASVQGFGRRNVKANLPSASSTAQKGRRSTDALPVKGTRQKKYRLKTRQLVLMSVASLLAVGLGVWCFEAIQAHEPFKAPFIMASLCLMYVARCLLFLLMGCGANDDDEISDFDLMGFGGFGGDGSDTDSSDGGGGD